VDPDDASNIDEGKGLNLEDNVNIEQGVQKDVEAGNDAKDELEQCTDDDIDLSNNIENEFDINVNDGLDSNIKNCNNYHKYIENNLGKHIDLDGKDDAEIKDGNSLDADNGGVDDSLELDHKINDNVDIDLDTSVYVSVELIEHCLYLYLDIGEDVDKGRGTTTLKQSGSLRLTFSNSDGYCLSDERCTGNRQATESDVRSNIMTSLETLTSSGERASKDGECCGSDDEEGLDRRHLRR